MNENEEEKLSKRKLGVPRAPKWPERISIARNRISTGEFLKNFFWFLIRKILGGREGDHEAWQGRGIESKALASENQRPRIRPQINLYKFNSKKLISFFFFRGGRRKDMQTKLIFFYRIKF